MKTWIRWFMTTRLYLWVARDVLSWIRISCNHTRLTGKNYREGYKLLRPGQIILSSDYSRISSFLTPGDLDHAALCVGVGSDYEVGEMTHKGYTKSLFFDICHTSDRVVILDCIDWDSDYKIKVIEKCRSFEDLGYDFQFQLDAQTLYCSELVAKSDSENRLKFEYSEYTTGLVITPQDIYEASNIKIIWDSAK